MWYSAERETEGAWERKIKFFILEKGKRQSGKMGGKFKGIWVFLFYVTWAGECNFYSICQIFIGLRNSTCVLTWSSRNTIYFLLTHILFYLLEHSHFPPQVHSHVLTPSLLIPSPEALHLSSWSNNPSPLSPEYISLSISSGMLKVEVLISWSRFCRRQSRFRHRRSRNLQFGPSQSSISML